MRDFLLFGLSPYLAALLLALVPAWRFLASPGSRRHEGTAEASGTPALWRWSLGLVLVGHAAAFLLPRPLMLWNQVSARLLVLEALGFALGAATLAGLILRLRDVWRLHDERRWGSAADVLLRTFVLISIVSGLAAAALYRWGSDWYAMSLLPWFRSLLVLRPDVSLVVALPPLVKLHVLAGIAAAAVLPFSEAVFALVRPVAHLARLAAAFAASAPGRLARGIAELAMIAALSVLLIGALRRV